MTDEQTTTESTELDGINWKTSIFLIATLIVAAVGTPLYWARLGVGWMEWTLFLVLFFVCGLTITAGYHRLFAHCTYSASWPVRLVTLLLGAATFQMSALGWASDHRYHHKFTDQDGAERDPHSIKKGFFWAHVGWLLVHVTPPLEKSNVADLLRDPLVRWQHRYYIPISIVMGFGLPTLAGIAWSALAAEALWTGALAGFLFGGCVRIVAVHHATFLINSWAHTIGRKPYDRESSARDSGLLALLTFGEGYHNYHHAFQNDYRNGIRAWHFDPAKWLIWALSKVGLVSNLRRVPAETVRLARIRAQKPGLEKRLSSIGSEVRDHLEEVLVALEHKLEENHLRLRQLLVQMSSLQNSRRHRHSERWAQLQAELREVRRDLRAHFRAWKRAHRLAIALAT